MENDIEMLLTCEHNLKQAKRLIDESTKQVVNLKTSATKSTNGSLLVAQEALDRYLMFLSGVIRNIENETPAKPKPEGSKK